MKISEMIAHLEKIKESSGDTEVVFEVRDYFSRYGFLATPGFDTEGCIWPGVNGNGRTTNLTIHLEDQQYPYEDVKHPKVTFRK